MRAARSGHLHPHCQRAAVGRSDQFGQPLPHATDKIVAGLGRRGVHAAVFPAEHVEPLPLEFCGVAIVDGHQHAPLGAGFADVAPLDVAGKEDRRVVAEHLLVVDVAQGPVVVMLRPQTFDRAGGIRLVPLAARGGSVQQADVEQPAIGGRIILR